MTLLRDIGMAALGGSILGISTSAYLALVGRVTGMSGTVRSTYLQLTGQSGPNHLNFIYLGGLLAGGAVMGMVYPAGFEDGGYSTPLMVGSGVLVGLGTTIGHGCTSGHGLCGLARFSKRSLVAVASFFCAGLITASSLYWVMKSDWEPSSSPPNSAPRANLTYGVWAAAGMLVLYGSYLVRDIYKILAAFGCSFTFAVGLSLSGMLKPTKVHGFLAVNQNWDPSLGFVMAGGLAVNLLLWPMVMSMHAPITCDEFDLPKSVEVKPDLVYGGILFGLGWGIGGVCPGPSVVGLTGAYGMSMLMWLLGCIAGQQAAVLIQKYLKSKSKPKKKD